jgi:hypothetical protein
MPTGVYKRKAKAKQATTKLNRNMQSIAAEIKRGAELLERDFVEPTTLANRLAAIVAEVEAIRRVVGLVP